MRIVLTEHARDRLSQRNIRKRDVIQTLKNPDRILKSFGRRKIAVKSIKEKTLEVVFREEKNILIVITSYWLEE
ncbi:MAG: hypothetical protein A2V73_07625 [candidate division Zixibacteria bacterium RBG_19FT_COMBO_42_43]|nr:MAG: hypothetical protein A2V73_07625 [candidate division Zixibacteria bacterium RBG_19FT_COMBO_42_43]